MYIGIYKYCSHAHLNVTYHPYKSIITVQRMLSSEVSRVASKWFAIGLQLRNGCLVCYMVLKHALCVKSELNSLDIAVNRVNVQTIKNIQNT